MKRATKQTAAQLRIIGGMWRGRKLIVVNRPGLRPTGDRVRETLFNWLTPVIADARMSTTRGDILTRLGEGERPEFDIHIEFTSNGRNTGNMTVRWTLKPATS